MNYRKQLIEDWEKFEKQNPINDTFYGFIGWLSQLPEEESTVSKEGECECICPTIGKNVAQHGCFCKCHKKVEKCGSCHAGMHKDCVWTEAECECFCHKKEPKWKPKDGERFYHFSTFGAIVEDVWRSGVDEARRDFLGVYPTKTAAEAALIRIKSVLQGTI